ncbi:hypothetical protein KN400_3470 [Geobacter sulfurreducens KN400]|nr:hypothetical protein KN400_3470 [Geobacter sulfurreducens KN400]
MAALFHFRTSSTTRFPPAMPRQPASSMSKHHYKRPFRRQAAGQLAKLFKRLQRRRAPLFLTKIIIML